ncbi:hypothetical protein PR202_ga28577 [Eleusine coracana subsp. coracana]|uniref:F-box domain-containing protein n=1 Tax=Eleusine coracana subsp. coracana TaxID=191504 RepID=A0AAV5DKP8_ELECO|nr:hypothetical protein PR202_ga28577 [Eleusine coracana subsp. coracana]
MGCVSPILNVSDWAARLDSYGGEPAAKRSNVSPSGALPDDVLMLILLHLETISEAVRTSGLSRRWRRVCTLLSELKFYLVWFQGPCELGDIVSSRCPGLCKLSLCNTHGLTTLVVRSESLLQMDLYCLYGLLQLKIDPSTLKELTLHRCFVGNNFLRLLQWFQFIHTLSIALIYSKMIFCVDTYYEQERCNFQYLMEDIKVLPNVVFLTMLVINQRHTFSASSFHVLRLCTGISRLLLVLHTSRELEVKLCLAMY